MFFNEIDPNLFAKALGFRFNWISWNQAEIGVDIAKNRIRMLDLLLLQVFEDAIVRRIARGEI
ncbi:hypothetical protein C1T17_01110 [Sphingobium sp. SCG-1]|nr:hypothetical protein C1T17_01110 [Sphingobium sp. SCG-1]